MAYVTLSLSRKLGRSASILNIQSEIFRLQGYQPTHQSIHATLKRLQKENLVSSFWRPPTEKQGGRRTRIWNPTLEGFHHLQIADELNKELADGPR